jgi:hypothetical protein
MNALQIALAVLSLVNLAFVIGAGYLLYEILRTSEASKTELIKAARQSTEGANQLLIAARRSVAEMERVHQAHITHETSSGRAIHELGRQVRHLSELVAAGLRPPASKADEQSEDEFREQERIAEDNRAKLRADLNAALAKNHQLQNEIDQTTYRLRNISSSNHELQQEIRDTKEVKKSVVDSLIARSQELEAELTQAKERAKAAEHHAEMNARLLDEIREQVHNQMNIATNAATGPDQTGLILSQQDQIDVMAAREKTLMEKIASLEDAIARNQTEKDFIEDRFLKIDAKSTPVEQNNE